MIAAGFGFRKSATEASLADALKQAGAPREPDVFSTLPEKVIALLSFAKTHEIPVKAVTIEEASAQKTMTQSMASQAETGLGSLAEACALAAAGPGARLLGPRVISEDRMATCAIAIGGSSE